MRIPLHIHGHIVPFVIATVIVCVIGVLAHAYWRPTPPVAEESPPASAFELQDDTVVTSSR